MTDHELLFIGGEWIEPRSTRRIQSVHATTGEIIGSAPEADEADVDAAVDAARAAYDDPTGWSSWEPAARADALYRLAAALDSRKDYITRLVSAQNGMPIAFAGQLESDLPQILLRYYADLVRDTPTYERRAGALGGEIAMQRTPIGVVGAIIPWNAPQLLSATKYAPALAAGATLVLKPSPETVLDTFPLAEAVAEAGIPPGVVNIVPGGREIGAYLVQHPQVDKISFTGSTAAGRQIGETCGRLLRPVSLELGGKSAAVILDDADLSQSIFSESFFIATMVNNGQACFANTRILTPRSRHDEVVDALAAFVSSLNVGDALDPSTQVGPLASSRQRDRVESYIATGKAEGSRVVVGGGRPQDLDAGWFVEPTVFAGVDNKQVIAQEEIFGPVLSVIPYDDDTDAVRIANDSGYGLAGSVWTADPDRALAVASQIRTGTIGLNRYFIDPVAPFGGVKASGIGKELGPEALASYQELKSIYM